MASQENIRAVMYGGAVLLDKQGRWREGWQESISSIKDWVEEVGVALPPHVRLENTELDDPEDKDLFAVIEHAAGKPRSYYELYARAMDRLRAWPTQILVVERNLEGMKAARALGSPVFAIVSRKNVHVDCEMANRVGVVEKALPQGFEQVERYVAQHVRQRLIRVGNT